jgi:large subunit ribosomal protein L4
MELRVINHSGDVVDTIEVSDGVWDAPRNDSLLHQAVVAQMANRRSGTHDSMRRSQSRYSSTKIRSQKGTGRARQGSRSSMLLGNSVAHGPHPRSHRQRLPKKMRRHALRVALSAKVREETLTVIDTLSIDAPKTRFVKDMVSALGLSGGALVVTEESNPVFVKSASNLENVKVLPAPELNPLEATAARHLLITRDAVKVVDSLWSEGDAS